MEASSETREVTGTYMRGTIDPFADDMKDMVNSRESSDVRFQVGKSSDVMYGHKVIISARCKVLKDLCLTSHTSAGGLTISLPDTSKQSFHAVLEFIYTNRVLLTDATHAIQVLKLSITYKLEELHKLCVEYLLENTDVTTASDIMQAAVELLQEKLKSAALAFIEENTTKIFEDHKFHSWTEETFCEVLKSDALDIDEIEVIDKVGEWADMPTLLTCTKKKVDVARPVVQHIRLPLLTSTELIVVDDANRKDRLISEDVFRAAYRTLLMKTAKGSQTKPRKGTKKREHHNDFK